MVYYNYYEQRKCGYLENILKNIYDNVVNGKDMDLYIDESIEQTIAGQQQRDVCTVFLSVTDKTSRALVIQGEGSTLITAIESLMQDYIQEKPANFVPYGVKLDIVNKFEKVKSKFDIRQDKIKYKEGLEGIALDANMNTAFLPQEITSYQLISKKRKKFRPLNIMKVFSRRLNFNLLEFTKQLDNHKKGFELYKFTTSSYYYDKDTFSNLYRGHQIFDNISKEDIWNSIQLTKDNYFKNVVNKKGKFIYTYRPQSNRIDKKYNILRHAGTTYSMLETYELMPDDKILELADKALNYLLNKQKNINVENEEYKVVVERGHFKLGGNALAIVAMAKYTQVTQDKKYISNMQSMASWMKATQDANGRFTVHKQNYETGEVSDFISHYYPGETILALVRLYQVDRNEEWLDVAEMAAKYLIQERDKTATIDTIAHDHWLLYALNDLYRERNNDIYLKHSFLIAEAIMKTQIKKGEAREELVGGYTPKSGNEPKSTPVACRSEGLSATYKLARDYGHPDMMNKIKEAIHQGIQFQLQMQLRPESSMYYSNKNLCLGAVQSGLKGYDLRNDYTQHNISSFIAYYNILNDK